MICNFYIQQDEEEGEDGESGSFYVKYKFKTSTFRIDLSIGTEVSVWKTGQGEIVDSMWVDQDKLDLNLSPTFIESIGREPMREIFALGSVYDDDSISSSSASTNVVDDLDDCDIKILSHASLKLHR